MNKTDSNRSCKSASNTASHSVAVGCLCAVCCEVLFGLSYMFTKQATEVAGTFALLGWRFFVAFLVMEILVLSRAIKIKLKGRPLRPLITVAVFSPCTYFIGETIGISNTTASESGVFLACIPVASLAASTLILKKRPTKIQITGIIITLTGVIITVIAAGISSSLSVIGYIFLLIAVLSYAFYSVSVDKASSYSGTEITYMMVVTGAAVFTILALGESLIADDIDTLIMLPFTEKSCAAAVLFQAIGCSILAFFLSNVAIGKIGVNRASSFLGVSTVVSILSGIFFLGETMIPLRIAGAVIIITGVYIANITKKGGPYEKKRS